MTQMDNMLNTPDVTIDTDGQPCPTQQVFPFDSLESVRKKLLDLSSRNSLLNYRHPEGKSIRLIDELPDEIANALRADRSLTLIPIPEPTEKQLIEAGYIEIHPEKKEKIIKSYPEPAQWAKHLELFTSYDLPDGNLATQGMTRYQDDNLQTLLYAPKLEARLRSLRSLAETAIEETGTSILYLALGFLEWYESLDSSTPRYAPLFTLPVHLEKSKRANSEGIFYYFISLKDDGLLTNVSLQEKLGHDFSLELPPLDEDTTPETYFSLVSEKLSKRDPRWRVRRQASLILLNFTKQAMFEDLNPANWPANANIQQHPLIARLFGASQQLSTEYYSGYEQEEHAIDHILQIHDKFPIVFDADSSQHSALIDVLNGENLVIEGPPGTGKSQTIANIIAACIANGKRVLFVAEKMAALNVVHDRLEKAGLGKLCLELHSHKTTKQKLLQNLGASLSARTSYRIPKEIDADVQRLESLKKKLEQYAVLINSEWKQTKLTLHEIFSKAVRYREQLGLAPEKFFISGINGENLTLERQKEIFERADMLRQIYDQVSAQAQGGVIANHYWYGVNNTSLMGYQAESLNNHLDDWTNTLTKLQHVWMQIGKKLDFDIHEESQELAVIWHTIAHIKHLPSLLGGEPLELIKSLSSQTGDFKLHLEGYESILEANKKIALILNTEAITQNTTLNVLQTSNKALQNLGITHTSRLEDVALFSKRLLETRQHLEMVSSEFVSIRNNIPANLQCCFIVSRQGLSELGTFMRLISALPVDLWRHRDPIYDNPDLDPLLRQLTNRLPSLIQLHKKLSTHFNLEILPSIEALKNTQKTIQLGGMTKWLSSEWRTARNTVLALGKTAKPDSKLLLDLLPELIQLTEQQSEIDRINAEANVLQDAYKGVDTPLGRVLALRQWYKSVRAEYGLGFGERVGLGDALLTLDRTLLKGIEDWGSKGIGKQASRIEQSVREFAAFAPAFLPLQQANNPLEKTFDELLAIVYPSVEALESTVSSASHQLIDVQQVALELERYYENVKTWNNIPVTAELKNTDLALSLNPSKFSQDQLNKAKRILKISQITANSPLLLKSLSSKPDLERYQSLQSTLLELETYESSCSAASQQFTEVGIVNLSDWAESTQGSLSQLIRRNQVALDNPKWLDTWLDYLRLRNKLCGEGLEHIVTQLENHTISTPLLNDAVQLAIHHQLSIEILEQHPSLSQFSGMEQMAIRSKFQEYDRKLLTLQRELIAYKASRTDLPYGNDSGKVGEYTELSLIKHNLNLKKPRIAIRTLVKRSGKTLQALKPCFMMSPMSVAQYLTPGQFNFDVVVMDEASQIRPEDALGSIARGKKLVVVGDPKQLPPTSFFQTNTNNGENDDDRVALESSESILETVLPMFKSRRLRWHYRSQHESLIAFSNQSFYDSNLVLFPSPLRQSDELGIRFQRVEKGRFHERRNVEEAKMLVAFALHQLANCPLDSFGIVAMNSEQSEEIQLQLEAQLRENEGLRKIYENNQMLAEPLFVKNLENVQGDERDVIIISMTYGPETAGSSVMHQRFGPINSDVGWRRLNVLFTRAKKRMHIYSSMGSGHIRTAESSSRGLKSLKAFLLFCETGLMHAPEHTGKAADSDFEIAVMDALSKHGYECEPQLGISGYRLDLAIKDPGMPGRFLMGVECDGASYHSAKSTRDRDRLRQDILESLGWCIRRIWSTDWFKNPQAQLQPILSELEKLKTPVQKRPETPITIAEIQTEPEIDRVTTDSQNHDEILDLRTHLINFHQNVILVKSPSINEQQRLLRPAMLDALLHYRPCSKAEFLETIPAYLRLGTEKSEGEFLEDALNIIAEYG